ncbi:hypothetical protein MAR_009772 [Mya arenaria]|uniref:VWFA domain-containing protein n=1 Tax=Mya arenaria TaxID=6604 RepID=A0ABY7E494_MYAAR|nr:hypothetical protein MAR_009772 [Mya arenaria]
MEREGIESMDCPARSPDLNPIEHVWDQCAASSTTDPVGPSTSVHWGVGRIARPAIRKLIRSFNSSCRAVIDAREDTGRFTNDIAWFMDKGVSVTWVVVGSSVANPGSYIYLPAIQDAQAIAQALTNTVLAGQSFSEADVVFLVDGSNSMEPDGFHASMKFLSTFADKVKVGPSNTQVALIVYTDYIIRCLLFSWNFDSETFKQTVSSIRVPENCDTASLLSYHWDVLIVTEQRDAAMRITEPVLVGLRKVRPGAGIKRTNFHRLMLCTGRVRCRKVIILISSGETTVTHCIKTCEKALRGNVIAHVFEFRKEFRVLMKKYNIYRQWSSHEFTSEQTYERLEVGDVDVGWYTFLIPIFFKCRRPNNLNVAILAS